MSSIRPVANSGTIACHGTSAAPALEGAGSPTPHRYSDARRSPGGLRRAVPDGVDAALAKGAPRCFVIDLSRLPSHGREIAIALRQSAATRGTPIVFCGGEPNKVKAIRALLPDAAYCGPERLDASVTAALDAKPAQAIVPPPIMDRYASRSAAQKLGIRTGLKVALLEAPARVETILGTLPPDVEFVETGGDVTLCFLHDPDAVRQAFSDLRSQADKTKLWMLWRKKTSGHHTGITEPDVRETGTSLGLVDYKICSVDKNWSAMLFARKRQPLRSRMENHPSGP